MIFSHATIIFDLDGTLVDSAPDLTAALNHVLVQEGLTPMAADSVRPLVGHGAVALLRAAYAHHDKPFSEDPDDAERRRLVSLFLDYYEGHLTDQSRPFEGIISCLERLKSTGAALAVCTNKMERLAFPLLEALELKGWFTEIICRDSLPEYKPSPLPLTTILERTQRQSGLMVGDTTTDLHAARAANMACAIAGFGYGELGLDGETLQKKEQRFEHFDALYEVAALLLERQKSS